jgi:hypothetical protein
VWPSDKGFRHQKLHRPNQKSNCVGLSKGLIKWSGATEGVHTIQLMETQQVSKSHAILGKRQRKISKSQQQFLNHNIQKFHKISQQTKLIKNKNMRQLFVG